MLTNRYQTDCANPTATAPTQYKAGGCGISAGETTGGVAVAAIAICFAGFVVRQHEINGQRAAFAKNVALVAAAQPLPSVEALKNFDTIQRMSQPRADEELLALMQ